jgi:hypothetical protein
MSIIIKISSGSQPSEEILLLSKHSIVKAINEN